MPFARFEIEQIEGNRWHAEIEAGGLPGGPNFRRNHLNGDSFEEIIAKVTRAYQALLPRSAEDETPAEESNGKDELLTYADEHGIEVDKRWGEGRLRAAIAAHEGK